MLQSLDLIKLRYIGQNNLNQFSLCKFTGGEHVQLSFTYMRV